MLEGQRQRIVVIFIVCSTIATLVLGGAVAYELGRRDSGTTVAAGANTATGTKSRSSTASGAATASNAGAAGGAADAGATGTGTASGGGTTGGGGAGAAAGQVGTQALTGGTVTVGGLFDETGPVDATVERDTVRAYFNKVNEAGGVNGKMLQLIDCDSKFNPTDAANCANKLINDNHVFAVVGSAGVGEDVTVKAFNDAGVPIVGGLGTPEEFKYPLSYPVSANFVTYGTAIANRSADLGFTDVGIIVVNVGFIAPAKDEIVRALHARNVTIKGDPIIVEATKPNYADVVLDLQSRGAKSIVAALDPFSYQRLFQSMQGAGYKPPLIGIGLDKGSANPSPGHKDQGYTDFVEGMHSLIPFLEPADHPEDPAVRDYLDTVKKYFPNQVAPLDVYTEGSWTAAQVFVDALQRAGPDPSQKTFVDALNATSGFQGGLSPRPISYQAGDTHDPNRCFWMLQNKGLIWTSVTEPQCF
jgi:branched-chain amino acid transport system substrate-binding protein